MSGGLIHSCDPMSFRYNVEKYSELGAKLGGARPESTESPLQSRLIVDSFDTGVKATVLGTLGAGLGAVVYGTECVGEVFEDLAYQAASRAK